MAVSGVSPTDDILSVEMLFRVEPQRQALLTYARNVLVLSLIISLFTAGLVYLALQQSIVRPVRRLSRAMSGFARRPLSSFEDLRSAKRRDGLGEASGLSPQCVKRCETAWFKTSGWPVWARA